MFASMHGGGPPANLNVDDALVHFKKRVDKILTELSNSKAAPSKIGQQEVGRASFGGNFTEADDLFREYNRVHTQLAGLSKVLGAQIEALRIAAHAADVGFDKVEDDVKRRFWELQTETQQYQQEQRQAAGDDRPRTDEKNFEF